MDTANLLVRQFVESHPRDAAQALEQLDILMKRLENFIEEESGQKMVEGNCEIAKQHYSNELLQRRAHFLLTNFFGTEVR